MVKVTSIEWDFDSLSYALGAGVTTATAGPPALESFSFGGEPCPTEVALHVQHQMCRSGDTINVYVWRAVGEGNVTLPFTHDEHSFEYSWKALRADADWASGVLPYNEQLIGLVRELAP
jgi:hypothetical protein